MVSAASIARFARASFWPLIEPERSRTKATVSGRRSARAGAEGAPNETWRYRVLPPAARTRRRSVFKLSDIGGSYSLLNRCAQAMSSRTSFLDADVDGCWTCSSTPSASGTRSQAPDELAGVDCGECPACRVVRNAETPVASAPPLDLV